MKDKEIATTEEIKSINPQNSEQQAPQQLEQETITPLMQAASQNNMEMILDLLSKGENLEEQSLIESTAVMFAAQRGHLKATQLLLERGSDAKHRNKYNWNPFLYAVYGKNLELVEWMIRNNYVVLNEFDVNTGLLVAAMNRNLAMLLLLFKYGKNFIKDRETILSMKNPYNNEAPTSLINYHFDMVRDIFAIENNTIEELDLQNDRDEYVEVFSNYLKNNRSIKKLSYRFSKKTFQNIEQFFQNNPVIKELTLSREGSYSRSSLWSYHQYEGTYAENIFSALNNNPNLKLRKLNLRDNKLINKQEIQTLAKLIERNPSLNELNLACCELNSEQAKMIIESLVKNNIPLEKLDLSSNKIGVDGAKSVADLLHKNSSLKYLNLSRNHDMDEGFFAFCGALEKNDGLEELDLSCTYPEKRNIEAIQRMLIKNKTLKRLDLAHNNFDQEAGNCIIEGLIQNNKIEEIDLSQSPCTKSFDAETGKKLGHLFKSNKSVKKIILGNNNELGSDGIKFLTEGLKENNTLQAIDLYEIGLNDESVTRLVAAIRKNNTIKHLRLDGNKITDIGAKCIAELLQVNKVPIQSLSLSYNPIRDKGYGQIFEALKKNNKLKTLSIGHNSNHTIGQGVSEVLFDALKYFNLTVEQIYGYSGDKIHQTNIKNFLKRNQKLTDKNTESTEIEVILKTFRSDRRKVNLSENPRFLFAKELPVFKREEDKKSEFSMK